MVGLGENLQGLGGHDMGRFSRALYEQVIPDMSQVCQGLGVSRVETGIHDSTRIRG